MCTSLDPMCACACCECVLNGILKDCSVGPVAQLATGFITIYIYIFASASISVLQHWRTGPLCVWLIIMEVHSFWTYHCRSWLVSDLSLSKFTYFGPTFFELDSFWRYHCRRWLILDMWVSIWCILEPSLSKVLRYVDLSLPNLTHLGVTFVELSGGSERSGRRREETGGGGRERGWKGRGRGICLICSICLHIPL